MKVVAGLGNPGREYVGTRHNVGFEVLAELARRHGAGKPKQRFEGECVEVFLGGEKVLLVAPQTYMNLSGRCIKKIVDFFQLATEEVLVVCDDVNLKLGKLRMRASGSAGGQKGLHNSIQQLGGEGIPRLRIGVGGPPERMKRSDFVLSRFWKEERPVIEEAIAAAADGVELWIREGIEAAMNSVNAPRAE